jgi:hypothetical protein
MPSHVHDMQMQASAASRERAERSRLVVAALLVLARPP